MDFKWHTRINVIILIIISLCLLKLNKYPQFEILLFLGHGWFHTKYASPDIDHKNSTPTRNIGLAGKVTSKSFKHRGLLHNPYFWTVLYIVIGAWVLKEYNYEAWWFTGGLIAIYSHIIVDKVSTKWKRIF